MEDRGEYLLGMDPLEVERLGRQHESWRAHTEHLWRVAGIRAGETVIDLGSGPGFCSIDLARIVGPAGRVVAVDASERALLHLRQASEGAGLENIETLAADVGAFDPTIIRPDVVFARWLLSFLPEPEELVLRLGHALRPGGRLVVMDYWNYLAIRAEPHAPLFTRVFEAVHRSFADSGGSLEVAGRVPAAMLAAGLSPTNIEMLPQVGRPGNPAWRWLSDFQRLYLPSLVAKGYLSQAELGDHFDWWAEMERRDDAFFLGPPVLAIVGVRA